MLAGFIAAIGMFVLIVNYEPSNRAATIGAVFLCCVAIVSALEIVFTHSLKGVSK